MRFLAAVTFTIIAALTSFAQNDCGLASIDFAELNTSNQFKASPDTIGLIKQKEVSGIVRSIKYPGHFWAINDSGNGAVLYLYSIADASIRGLFILRNVSNTDWEDLSIDNNGIIYIPDFGDNDAKREAYTIFKIPEPDFGQPESKINEITADVERIRFTYKNGARDAEAFAFDPVDRVSYIISKREKNVFVYPLPLEKSDSTLILEPIGNLPFSNVVAADFSSDGMKFMLKTYTNIYLWGRESADESFCNTISRVPENVSYQLEPQGESLCFMEDSFITVSEERFGLQPWLYYYPSSN